MYRIEVWDGPLYFNGRRHMAVCDHAGRRIIVSRSGEDDERDRLEAVARAVRMELIHKRSEDPPQRHRGTERKSDL